MLTKQLSDELEIFLQRYLAFYKDFLQVELEKFDAVSSGDVKKIDSHVVKEQALMLQSRGFELERDQLISKELKLPITFKELIPLFDDDNREAASAMHDELSSILLDLKDVNNRSNTLAELQLHKIDNNIRQLEKKPAMAADYNNSAKVASRGKTKSGVISRKV